MNGNRGGGGPVQSAISVKTVASETRRTSTSIIDRISGDRENEIARLHVARASTIDTEVNHNRRDVNKEQEQRRVPEGITGRERERKRERGRERERERVREREKSKMKEWPFDTVN